MNILVIFTGGTIGSVVDKGYISPDKSNKFKLIEMYRTREKSQQKFETEIPYTILSENLDGEYITKLIKCVDKNIKSEQYDGIIITHGTDTLQYTAAVLSIVFSNLEIPLLLVSSNYPLDDSRANGYENFKAAVEYIKGKGLSGVYVPYKNTGEDMQIFTGNNIIKYDIYSDKLRSLPNLDKEIKDNITEASKSQSIDPSKIQLDRVSPVLYLTPYPGMQYIVPGDDIKVVLFGSYHSGTIQTEAKELRTFCQRMKERNVPVYLCGANDGIGYESTRFYKELGIQPLPYGTDIYWYMRLWIENV